ncbi:MAG: L-seryl-tRNA(Sec) selenium transferase [Burkholderiaceae bacterium]
MPDLTLPGSGEASESKASPLSQLPAVDRLLNTPQLRATVAEHGALLTKRAVQEVLQACREAMLADAPAPASEALIERAQQRVTELRACNLRPVFNLSGTVIHTNLGRALLADEAIDAVGVAMRNFAALEYDLASGERGDRDRIVEDVLCELTGAEAATVVNNNAAAVLLSLKALASRKEAIISRGELIEIGGSFRMPDIMKAAGCKLIEVGTTNRTHARDYEEACGARTGLIVKAHWSNYAITGFTAVVDDATLAQIAHANKVPYMVDLGAGALIDLTAHGLPREPMPQESIAAGADVVTFSGDKVLGGPQAGLIVGRRDAIARIKKDPLKRALRVSKLTMAALEATLRIYASGHQLEKRLPTLALLARKQSDVREACHRIAEMVAITMRPAFEVTVEDCASQIGSGSMPAEHLASAAIVVSCARKAPGRAIDRLHQQLRALPVPVIGRVADGALWLDVRCLWPRDEPEFVRNLQALTVR